MYNLGYMYTRLYKQPESQSFFIFGPRGVGKSLWLRTVFKADCFIDLLRAETYNSLSANPSRMEELIPPNAKSVVLDEVQKLPSLLDEVHRLIETRKLRFALTGSSARKLKKQGVNLLAGRALTTYMHPLSTRELGNDFNLRKSLQVGHLPMAYTADQPQEYLHSYIKTYLKEEIQQEGLVRNLMGFSRFLESASYSQGQLLNISKVASDSAVDRKVVEEYFRILEDFLVAIRIPPFTKRATRAVTRHPKFFFFDCGIYRTLRPKGPLDSTAEIDGPALETLVLQELRAVNEYSGLRYEFFYWGLQRGPDVDFVMYGEHGMIAIEVKRTNRLRGGELDGLVAFKKQYRQAACFFVYLGNEERQIDGISVLPAERFFHELPSLLRSPCP